MWINSIPNRYTRRDAVEILAAASGLAAYTLTDSEPEEEEEGDGMGTQSPAQRARWMDIFHGVCEVKDDACVVCVLMAAYNCRTPKKLQ